MYNTLVYEKRGRIGIVKVNRPDALNALNAEVIGELDAVFDEIVADAEVGAAILTGEGRAFVAGADIAAMQKMNPAEGKDFMLRGQAVMQKIEDLKKPVIAAVNGFALGGGCELAMACDIRLASDKAKFGQPEVNLGIVPGFGGTQRLPRLVGRGMAKLLIFSAETIGAEEALRIGLADRVYPAEELLDKAIELAETLLSKGPIAIAQAKEAINRGLDTDLKSGVSLEADAQCTCFATEDKAEGMAAFLEKRPAKFTNK